MIEVDNISFTYPSGVEALKEITVEVKDPDFIAIIGENGAGKTTFIKHLNGILKPTQGEIYINGLNTKKASVAELSRDVGIVFQNPDHQLFCETVEEEIAFGLKNFGFNKDVILERVTWALNLLDLARYRKVSPFMLSGGERKRVALATILAWDPKILVLDEPTIGQDFNQKDKLRQFIIQLNSQGRTVIMVTHDVEFVADCNPRVIVMSNSRIINDGSAKEVLTNFDLLSKASVIPPQITQLFSQLSDLDLPQNIIDLYEAKQLIIELAKERFGNEGL
jgi:energy-coupling factor transport system ATP-binding protein